MIPSVMRLYILTTHMDLRHRLAYDHSSDSIHKGIESHCCILDEYSRVTGSFQTVCITLNLCYVPLSCLLHLAPYIQKLEPLGEMYQSPGAMPILSALLVVCLQLLMWMGFCQYMTW